MLFEMIILIWTFAILLLMYVLNIRASIKINVLFVVALLLLFYIGIAEGILC